MHTAAGDPKIDCMRAQPDPPHAHRAAKMKDEAPPTEAEIEAETARQEAEEEEEESMLDEGDVVEIVCAGGGGFGPPHDRDPALIQEDLRQGYVISAVVRSGDGAR